MKDKFNIVKHEKQNQKGKTKKKKLKELQKDNNDKYILSNYPINHIDIENLPEQEIPEEELKHLEEEFQNTIELEELEKERISKKSKKDKSINDSILNWYLNEIHKIPMLSREEEYETALKAMKGDESARNKLVRANLRFVVTIAKKYQSYGLTLMDLINEGNVGLIRAAERFNPERGYHFISYAVWWIRQSIKYAIQQKSQLIRLPLNKIADLRRIDEAEHWFENQNEIEGTIENIAEYVDKKPQEINHLLQVSKEHLSLDAPLVDSDDFALVDGVHDDKSESPSSNVEFEELRKEILKSLDQLTEREKKIIMLRFGLDGGPVYSLQKIGKMIGLSKERVRQIEKKALRKIRTGKNAKELSSFL
ncbi:MAG: hypothetical protein KatS3mg129_0328 [Leptospiraceae bacterium]|nr:MAG: hypothetical protein KatS3mg129_0328 [Leptospiraceae bacterium]